MFREKYSKGSAIDEVMSRSVHCYTIVMVPNKRSLHQGSGSGMEPGTCIVSNHCGQ